MPGLGLGNIGGEGNGRSHCSGGKAKLLALGKALPKNVLYQDKFVETYLHGTSCDDPATRAKLERLCELLPSFMPLPFFTSHFHRLRLVIRSP
jgi:hypothetical protein